MAIGFQYLSTLTPQQQQIANQLQSRVSSAGTPPKIDPQATADYVRDSVATPLLRQYDQVIMPRLKDSFASVGALMSSRRGFAQQQALQQLQDTIGSELGKAQLQNQQLNAQLALQYNQLGSQMVGQQNLAIQPYKIEQPQGLGYGSLGTNSNGQLGYQPQPKQSVARYEGPASFGQYAGGSGSVGYYPPVMGHADLYGQEQPIDQEQAQYYTNQYQG